VNEIEKLANYYYEQALGWDQEANRCLEIAKSFSDYEEKAKAAQKESDRCYAMLIKLWI